MALLKFINTVKKKKPPKVLKKGDLSVIPSQGGLEESFHAEEPNEELNQIDEDDSFRENPSSKGVLEPMLVAGNSPGFI